MSSKKLNKKTNFEQGMEQLAKEVHKDLWSKEHQESHTRWRNKCSELGRGLDPNSEEAKTLREAERYQFKEDELVFQERGIDYTLIPGGFIVYYNRRKYWYWPGSRKWRVEGNKTIYRCYDANQLLNKYILKINS